ncbi:cysteine-rich protein 2-binding protein [Spodoptera litura]|uniref:Cysteine-rich protein 2-binding protein n=1 Tax=Spodoptera litura TaxID=69820 RepID=A0A9J7INT8_SPOLT|nr:cysteine-rich protein 2-binding protein [Spodoptera litura]
MSVPPEGAVVIPDAVMSSLSTACKYCSEPENKQDRPSLVCGNCFSYVHINCLRRSSTPGDFACDVFFDFVCEDCSLTNREVFKRNRFPWVSVIYLTLHHLNIQSYGISNHGYFHYKTHICSFIDRYWQALFGSQIKQKKNWVGTIAGVLSVYNKLFFKSGSAVLGETGWWKLLHNFSPAVAAHILQEVSKDKPKVRPRNQPSIDKNLFLAKVTEMGYKDLINNESSLCMPPSDPVPCKKRRVDSDELSGVSSTSFYDQQDSDGRNELADEYVYDDQLNLLTHKDPYSDLEFKGFDFAPSNHLVPAQSDSSSIHSFQPYMMYDSDSHSRSGSEQETRKVFERPKKPIIEEKPIRRESLFSTELNSVDNPWEDPLPKSEPDLVEMTQYEEIQLLKKVDNLILRVKDPNKKGYLSRLRAKLALRRLKRHKHLPVFDLDKEVKILGGYVSEDPRTVVNSERVLDRFQRSYLIDNLSGTIASTNYGTLLLSDIEPTPYRSLYSGATLKPYIRRDGDSAPTWLKLTDELLRRTNRHVKDYEPPPRATIDYSYVRPQHIAAVNNLCAQFFWPGIDLTEALQYPEFSCVVTYKRLVIGCAFLVPDVSHNEAYISFVLTRPEWRNAKIATFMLYHLLQTCTGKDVTLHVSPTNPAIFLYQKFGFKVEELIQDFYEKYYDIDYKGCRHALFLRLVR